MRATEAAFKFAVPIKFLPCLKAPGIIARPKKSQKKHGPTVATSKFEIRAELLSVLVPTEITYALPSSGTLFSFFPSPHALSVN